MGFHDYDDDDDDGLIVVYVLAPITAIVAIAVIAYIAIKQRQLTKRLLQSGQLVPVVPACVTYQTYPAQQPYPTQQVYGVQQATQQGGNFVASQYVPQPDIRSPSGLPPPPPYSK